MAPERLMLTVYVRLLHGVLRAGSADDLALTAEGDPGEWPPSPARLVAALVAADGTRDRCHVTSGWELDLFERCRPPRIYASPASRVLSSRLRNRYVVINTKDDGTVQEYPARQAQLVRPGTRLCPADPRIAYVWEDLEPNEAALGALAARAARVGYLGCADSPACVTVSTGFEPTAAPATVWRPDRGGDRDLPVPFPGFIAILDQAFDAWRAGQPTRRSWFRTERERYCSPDDQSSHPTEPVWPTTVWLRFEQPLPGRAALRVAETLKAAVLDCYQRYVAAAPGEVPAVLHGHGREGDQGYQLAQWLVLPDVGHRHAQGRLHGAAIMLPRGVGPDVIEGVRHAVWRIRDLAVPGLTPTRVRVHGGEPRPRACQPDRWRGPARRWASALPVVHERRSRHGPILDDVALWCQHAGVPAPGRALCSPVPILPGSPALRPEDVFRDRPGARRPYSYVELEFGEPVMGPVVLGRARQFGMGLMAPLGDGDGDR